MKRNKYLGMMLVASLFATTSCSDFNDYNEVSSDATTSASKTLWENINETENLSNFASLIKRAGYVDELNSSKFYTVWAPVNEDIDMSLFEGYDSKIVLEQFVKNHMAMYNHSLTGDINDRIHTLNKKTYDFTSENGGQFDNIQVVKANIPSSNGVMHTVGGIVNYYPNLYDFLFLKNSNGTGINGLIGDKDNKYTSQPIDSVSSYFKKYELSYLDLENSVVGPIVDGKQTYIDSVVVKENSLLRRLGYLDREDSLYTFLIPTNDVWNKEYSKIKSRFNYIDKTMAQNLEASTSASNIPSVSVSIDNALYSDSLSKMSLIQNLVFNNNNIYNKWVEDHSVASTDTLYTTIRSKLSNPKEILDQTIQKLNVSNGYVRVIDSLALHPWEAYTPQLNYSRNEVGRILSGTRNNVNLVVNSTDPTQEDLTYRVTWAVPTGKTAKPEVDVKLPNVQSTTYNFYCVLATSNALTGDAVAKPNQLNFILNYCNEKGVLANWNFSSDMKENPKTQKPFENDITVPVDTIYIGQFTFPICYQGLGSDYTPNIKMTSPFSMFSTAYSRDICFIEFILKPIEQDEYEATKQ